MNDLQITTLTLSPTMNDEQQRYTKNPTFKKNNTMSQEEEFNRYRAEMNERLLSNDNLVIKRFFSLDTQTYASGALDVKTKELLGLAASMVLRCDDCIKYHLGKCMENKVNRAEVLEVFQVALMVGGSIVIPHTRRAYEYWEELEKAHLQ